MPFSDESRPRGDAYDYALSRMQNEMPFIHVGRALRYLGVVQIAPLQPNQAVSGRAMARKRAGLAKRCIS